MGDYDANYIGEWHSDTVTLTNSTVEVETYMIINGDNSEYGSACEVNCTVCQCNLVFSGKAVINRKHKKLYIGKILGDNRVKLSIDTPPYQNGAGKWICVINDVTMYKQ